MKKITGWLFAFVLLFSLALPQGTTFAQDNTVKLLVDGVEVQGYEQSFMSNEQVLIPVENLFEEAGYNVSKDAGKVSVTNNYLSVDFQASKNSIEVDGKKVDTEFPLTLKNGGNYISGEFLGQLEGFTVELSEDNKTVNVTTNRVSDVDAFLKKTQDAGLNSYSAKMTLDQKSSMGLETMNMLMDIEMNMIEDPLALYTLTKLAMEIEGEKISEESASYMTKDGFFVSQGDQWIKYDDEMTEGLFDLSELQADPFAQLEQLQEFIKGIHVYEYDDVYVVTYTVTNEEFTALMEEITSILSEVIVSEEATEEEATVETSNEEVTEAIEVTVAATDAVVVEATEITEEAIEVNLEEIEAIEGEVIVDLFEDLSIQIDNFFFSTTIDKETYFPLDVAGTMNITIGLGEESVSTSQTIVGSYSNHNQVEEIVVPADVIANAISFEDYIKAFEAEFEAELAAELEAATK